MPRRRFFASIAFVGSTILTAFAGDAPPAELVRQWLTERDHAKIPWRVVVGDPYLTLEQRDVIEVHARVEVNEDRKDARRHDLHFMTAFGDGKQWFPEVHHLESSYLPENGPAADISFDASAYVKPGRYRIALVLYDSALDQHNVMHRWVTVKPLRHDPLPNALDPLPLVEFREKDRVPTVGAARLLLPLDVHRPVNIDVIVNFTPSPQFGGDMELYRQHQDDGLQLAYVLSQMQIAKGCMWLTGIDVAGMRVLFERLDAASVDWKALADDIKRDKGATVALDTLTHRKDSAGFVRSLLERFFQRPQPPCEGARADAQPLPVYILAGATIVFPRGTRIEPMSAQQECGCRFYSLAWQNFWAYDSWDQIARIIKPVNPRKFRLVESRDLRKALAAILADLHEAAASP